MKIETWNLDIQAIMTERYRKFTLSWKNAIGNSRYHERTEAVIVLKRYSLFYLSTYWNKRKYKKLPHPPFLRLFHDLCTPKRSISFPCIEVLFPYWCHSRENQLPNINTAFIFFYRLRAEQKSEALLLNIMSRSGFFLKKIGKLHVLLIENSFIMLALDVFFSDK